MTDITSKSLYLGQRQQNIQDVYPEYGELTRENKKIIDAELGGRDIVIFYSKWVTPTQYPCSNNIQDIQRQLGTELMKKAMEYANQINKIIPEHPRVTFTQKDCGKVMCELSAEYVDKVSAT